MRLPDFIIAGAPRCGTTWLCHLLDRHPDVALAKPLSPEPKFFLADSIYERGLEYYSKTWFSSLTARIVGEKSTNYLEDSKVAGRIKKDLGQVRLIFVLRDPAERAWSNYRWSQANGLEPLSFFDAIKAENRRPVADALRYARPFSYVSRGFYADLLAPYLASFPNNQILCLKFEEMMAQPAQIAVKLHEFLDVDARPGDADGIIQFNAGPRRAAKMPVECRRRLAELFSEPNQRLSALIRMDTADWTHS